MSENTKKQKYACECLGAEERNVCYDILHNSLWNILKAYVLLEIVWTILAVISAPPLWVESMLQAVIGPVVFALALGLFELCFAKLCLPINDIILLLVLNLAVFSILICNWHTHSLQVICVMPIVFGMMFKNRKTVVIQAFLSAGIITAHHMIAMFPIGHLTVVDNVFMDLAEMWFDIAVFFIVVIQIRKYTQMLNTQTTIDSLTRLHNHESFYEMLDKKLEEYQGSQKQLSILIADIDNFKQVNDTYGHAYGDRVLKILADIFAEESGRKCFVARYGGEEFAMIMEMNQSDAITKAQSIRKRFERQIIPTDMGVENSFTISVGVAVYQSEYKTSSQFFERADEALYKAKKSGKNRVCL